MTSCHEFSNRRKGGREGHTHISYRVSKEDDDDDDVWCQKDCQSVLSLFWKRILTFCRIFFSFQKVLKSSLFSHPFLLLKSLLTSSLNYRQSDLFTSLYPFFFFLIMMYRKFSFWEQAIFTYVFHFISFDEYDERKRMMEREVRRENWNQLNIIMQINQRNSFIFRGGKRVGADKKEFSPLLLHRKW